MMFRYVDKLRDEKLTEVYGAFQRLRLIPVLISMNMRTFVSA